MKNFVREYYEQLRGCLLSRVQPCDPVDCSPPDTSVHQIFQARILEWVAISFSRGSSQPRDQPKSFVSPASAGGFFTTVATREAHEQLCDKKLNNPREMDKFIEINKLPQVTQDKTEIFSRPVTNEEIASVIKNPSTKESPKPDSFNGEFYQTFKEELT